MRGLFGALAGQIEGKADGGTVFGSIEEMWRGLFGSYSSRSGETVSWQKSLEVTTILACVRRIAEGNATVPLKVYRKVDGQRQEATGHPLFDLLATAPNDWQNSLEFRETLSVHAALAGNAYVFKNWVQDRIVELLPLDPGSVTVDQDEDYRLQYRVTGRDGSVRLMSSREIWHIRGTSWDSIRGLDVVKLAREAIGLALATEHTHAEFHANGVRPSGIVSVEGTLDDKQLVKLAAWVKANFAGVAKTGRVLTVDRKADFKPIQMTGVDSQHLETRNHQIEELCRALGVLPIMVGHYDKAATYASVEQMLLAHLIHTVRPNHRRLEYSMDHQLLTQDERRAGYYTGFTDAEFLRAAAKDRAEFYKVALGGGGNPGWLRPNDVRSFEDLSPETGGDHLYAPIALGPIGPDGRPQGPDTAAPSPKGS